MRFLQFCGLILLGGLVSCSWQSAPTPPPVEPQPLSPVAQFMVANATGATAVIEDETFGGEVRVTLEDAFLSAAGETCKRATLLSAQHEAEIVVICHNPRRMAAHAPRVGQGHFHAVACRHIQAPPSGAPGGAFPVVLFWTPFDHPSGGIPCFPAVICCFSFVACWL